MSGKRWNRQMGLRRSFLCLYKKIHWNKQGNHSCFSFWITLTVYLFLGRQIALMSTWSLEVLTQGGEHISILKAYALWFSAWNQYEASEPRQKLQQKNYPVESVTEQLWGNLIVPVCQRMCTNAVLKCFCWKHVFSDLFQISCYKSIAWKEY